MKRRTAAGLLFFCYYFCIFFPVNGSLIVDDIAIDHINLLLPKASMKTKISVTLEAFNGCFRWSSTNPEVASVDPIYNSKDNRCAPTSFNYGNTYSQDLLEDEGAYKCSTKAVVTAVSVLLGRTSSWIIAEDITSGRRVRCEVYVDEIKHIQVDTTTREMYRDDVEVLKVRAWDDKGNVFSSLEGLRFQWSISPDNPASSSSVLQFVPFKDSNIEISPKLLEMEERGLESCQVLVKGVETGRAKVAARLVELGYTEVDQHTVSISVREPLQLSPLHPVYITPGTRILYVLQTYNRDNIRDIRMPNSLYKWSTGNTTVATVNSEGLLIARELGKTSIRVEYETLNENFAQGDVSVVIPAYINLKIVPESQKKKDMGHMGAASTNWYLVSQTTYILEVEVYDSDSHRLYNTDNCIFEVTLSDKYFRTVKASPNQSSFTVTTIKEGLTPVTATLKSVFNPETKEKIDITPTSAGQDVVISAAIKVHPQPQVVLPFVDGQKAKIFFTVQVTGGTGEYNWLSGDTGVSAISASGVLSPQGIEETAVVAVDRKNPTNRDSTKVIVSVPHRLKFLPHTLEIQVGSILNLPLAVYDDHSRQFNNCTGLPLEWKISDDSIFSMTLDKPSSLDNEVPKESCTTRHLLALREGHASVIVSYGEITAEVLVFAFTQLSTDTEEALVTLGSSAQLVFVGGPNPWHLEPSAFYSRLTEENTGTVQIERLSTTGRGNNHAFRVTCLQHGRQKLIATVGNRATTSNIHPATQSYSVFFACEPPSRLMMYPEGKEGEDSLDRAACSVRDEMSMIFPSASALEEHFADAEVAPLTLPPNYLIRNSRILAFNVILLDARGHRYTNFSSLNIRWSSSNNDMAHFLPEYSEISLGKTQRLLEVSSQKGELSIEASATGYNLSYLKQAGIGQSHTLPSNANLSKTIRLSLVPNVRLSPQQVLVYNHEANSVKIHAIDGSNFFKFSSNNTEVLQLHYEEGKDYVEVLPLKSGVALVQVVDRCLAGSEPASSIVKVSEVSAIEVKARDLVLLGHTTEVEVIVKDSSGQPFASSQFPLIDIKLHVDSNCLEVEPVPNNPSRYIAKGLAVGIGRIIFSSSQRSGRLVSSVPKSIEVYPPFELKPERIVLLPTASFQLYWRGGPSIGGDVSFHESSPVRGKDSIVSVDKDGRVVALREGESIVTALVSGFDNVAEAKSTYGEDSTTITVKYLSGLRIWTPSNRLLVGQEFTLRVIGLNDEEPFAFSSGDVRFQWETRNPDAAALVPVYVDANVTLSEEADFSVRVQGNAAGASRINVRVSSAPKEFRLQGMSASLLLTVLEPLDVLGPKEILLSPGSSYHIQTNRDSHPQISYRLLACTELNTPNIISLQPNGAVVAGNTTGIMHVIISDSETFETIAVKFTVHPIHTLQLLPRTKEVAESECVNSGRDKRECETKRAVHYSMPVGSTMLLDIILRNGLGFAFHEVGSAMLFDTELDTQDVISVKTSSTNRTVSITASKPGHVILKTFSLSGEKLEDFIRIRVGNAIVPSSPVVHIGGHVHFSTYTDTNEGHKEKGTWWSQDNKIATVVSDTGIATAHQVGSTSIYHHGRVHTYTKIYVVKVAKIALTGAVVNSVLNNVIHSQEYIYNVNFFAEDGVPLVASGGFTSVDGKRVPTIDHNIQFKCYIDEKEWGVARKEISYETGQTSCIVTPYSPERTAMIVSSCPTSLTLHVVASDGKGEILAQKVESLSFACGFYLNTKEVKLSIGSRSFQFEVKHVPGNAPKCTASDPDKIACSRVSTSLHGDSSFYEISVMNPRFSFDGVTAEMYDSMTGQSQRIFVSFVIQEPELSLLAPKHDDQSLSAVVYVQPPSSWTDSVTLILVLVIIMLVLLITLITYNNWANSSKKDGEKKDKLVPATPVYGSEYNKDAFKNLHTPDTQYTPLSNESMLKNLPTPVNFRTAPLNFNSPNIGTPIHAALLQKKQHQPTPTFTEKRNLQQNIFGDDDSLGK